MIDDEELARMKAAIPPIATANKAGEYALQLRLIDEILELRERLGPRGLEVVMIDGAGHYVNEKVREHIEELRAALQQRRIEALEEAAQVCEACCHSFPACGVALSAINAVIAQARAALGKP